jgi:DNA repair protein RecO (recombination protein O)
MRFILEPAYILHTRAYQDTSLLVELFTQNHGKVTVLARSARGNRSRFKGCLVPFSPLLITASGKTDLLHLTSVETNGSAFFLQGKMLFNGLYLNELLMKLLQRLDPFPDLYVAYANALKELRDEREQVQSVLRGFEITLLTQLGYGLQLDKESNGADIQPNVYYYYRFEQGLIPCAQSSTNANVFLGSSLLAIAEQNFTSTEILSAARRLMRLAIGTLLGDYQIKTRELFS